MIRFVMAALLALSLFVATGNVRASDDVASSGGTYSTTVPVTDTGDAARDAAFTNALAAVIQKVAPQTVPTADVLAQASSLVRNFKYQRAASGSGLQLQVDFDPGSIQHLLKQRGAGAATASVPAAAGTSAGASVAGGAGGSGTLWVGGLNSTSDFAALLSTLRQSPQLHNIVPVGAHDDGVLLQLDYDASLPIVLTALISAGHLQAAPAHPGADASARWVR